MSGAWVRALDSLSRVHSGGKGCTVTTSGFLKCLFQSEIGDSEWTSPIAHQPPKANVKFANPGVLQSGGVIQLVRALLAEL